MSMGHKAFPFDYTSFSRELKPVLEQALASNDSQGLVLFIDVNLNVLSDPYEGKPLGNDWLDLLEFKDAHQYGDFALTKYYDPLADIGVGDSWTCFQSLLGSQAATLLLGERVGPKFNYFDPGKMGSYFQSAETVTDNALQLEGWLAGNPTQAPALSRLSRMLRQGKAERNGLYISF